MKYRVSIAKRKHGYETVVYVGTKNHYVDIVPTRSEAEHAANQWIARHKLKERTDMKFFTMRLRSY